MPRLARSVMTSSRELTLLVQLLAFLPYVFSEQLCANSYCQCLNGTHPDWNVVNCTLSNREMLDITKGQLPDNTNELIIMGGGSVRFLENALSHLKDPRLIRVSDIKSLRFFSNTGTEINTINLIINIRYCDKVKIDKFAFTGTKGPISVDIANVIDAAIGNNAFSWLLKMHIAKVANLVIDSGSFMLDPFAPNVADHGPGMTITIMDSVMESLPAQSFASSAALITLKNLEIGRIHTDAFSANTYNAVMITNCSVTFIESESFGKKSLIYELKIQNSSFIKLSANALISGVSALEISNTIFYYLSPSSMKGTYASIIIYNSTFKIINEHSFEFKEWNTLKIDKNKFDQMPANAIVAKPTAVSYDFSFTENEVEVVYEDSLTFVGQIFGKLSKKYKPVYKDNYYGHSCTCNLTNTLSKALGLDLPIELINKESHCTVNSEIAHCFNIADKNMQLLRFQTGICVDNTTIVCEPFDLNGTDIKNPRFPHEKEVSGMSTRNVKVLSIIIVTCVGAFILAVTITLIRGMRHRGYCYIGKSCRNPNSSCNGICNRMCHCGGGGIENAGSISQVSVQELSELHRLNEPRVDIIQETRLPQMYTEEVIQTDNKTTQTLPQQLTKELLENLKEKLDDPEKYVEAREMIEHLYELIKVDPPATENREVHIENIYEIPFENTMPRIGRNNKQMVSVGTRTPSIERLQPLSPYNRNTSLAHEYFEPRDFAIHLYAEIAHCDKEKKKLLGVMPDVVGDQMLPRGPYLSAMREKEGNTSPYTKQVKTSYTTPNNTSSIKSSKSMQNRPLPRKPVDEGTSYRAE